MFFFDSRAFSTQKGQSYTQEQRKTLKRERRLDGGKSRWWELFLLDAFNHALECRFDAVLTKIQVEYVMTWWGLNWVMLWLSLCHGYQISYRVVYRRATVFFYRILQYTIYNITSIKLIVMSTFTNQLINTDTPNTMYATIPAIQSSLTPRSVDTLTSTCACR